ncbi:MAG: hypothetical protein R3A10_04650 [Caldilineaceae bacterium]
MLLLRRGHRADVRQGGQAEVLAAAGVQDMLIANQVVETQKYRAWPTSAARRM